MLGAGLLARKAVELGLDVPGHVKTSLAPGSQVVTRYLTQAGLLPYLEGARFPRRRLWLHDLHRQLGAAARTGEPRRRGERTGRFGGPFRQPQLRGTHPLPGAGGVPRLPAAGRRLRAGRHGRSRSRDRSRSAAIRTASPSTCATSGRRRRRSAPPSRPRSTRRCSARNTRWSSPAMSAGKGSTCRPATSTSGARTRPTCRSRPSSRTSPMSQRRRAISTARGCWRCLAIRSRPITSPRPGASPRTARPVAT